MRLPEQLLQSLEGVEGFNRESFVAVHERDEQVTSVRINPAKITVAKDHDGRQRVGDLFVPHHLIRDDGSQAADALSGFSYSPFTIDDAVPWSRYGLYLEERPSFTFDPLFHAGCYYVQEASSMFLEQALVQLTDLSTPLKVLDLCAAPGGKSTHIQSLLSAESLLVSNEIIKSRNNILIDNIKKWGGANVIVSNNDPSAFKKLEGYFDVMVVDAPCSGSGLFRKDEDAIGEWSVNNVQLCSQRQQRILADALPALKEGGLLVYSTCSYSKEEDEAIADWLVSEMEMKNVGLSLDEQWQIVETESERTRSKGYRFFPYKTKGEGFFLACFQKQSTTRAQKQRGGKIEKVSAREREIIEAFLQSDNYELVKNSRGILALSKQQVNDYAFLSFMLNVQYAGTQVGQIMKDRLVPGHALALSTIISKQIPTTDVGYDDAIKFLQRQDVNFNTSGKGWQVIRFAGYNLGWVNVLPNRVNNYYPKELRILKSRNDSSFEK